MNKLRHSLQIFFQRFHAKFSVTLIAKETMDRAKLGFSLIETYLLLNPGLDKIIGNPQNLISEEEDIAAYKKEQLFCVIREAIRDGFIIFSKKSLMRNVRRFSYERRMDIDFFVEQYAFELFPPLPAPKKLRQSNSQEGGDCRKNPGEDTSINVHQVSPSIMDSTDPRFPNAVFGCLKHIWGFGSSKLI